MPYAWHMAGELGRGSVENLASEPSEPADGLLITGKTGGGGTEKRYKWFINKSINSTCIFVMNAICYAHILAA